MNKTNTFDVIVIGSGSAGFSAALAAKEVGASVCMIEKDRLGGECPNYACVPTKALLKAAGVYRMSRKAENFGVTLGSIKYDFESIMEYRKKVVETITGGGEKGDRYIKLIEQNKIGIEYGEASFVDENTVEVADKTIHGKSIIIATGTVDFMPPIQGLEETPFLTWKDVNNMHRQPNSLAVIGGGPVGSEIATFFGTLGTRVVLFQSAPTILSREDAEIAQIAHEAIADSGVNAIGNAKVLEIMKVRGGVYGLKVEINGTIETHAADQVLLAAGKRSNTKGLKLETLNIKLDDRGSIKTNKEQRTSIKNIFAAGDVDGGYQFTHTAHHEGSVAGYNAALTALKKRNGYIASDLRVVPRVTFLEPEIASVGMTGQQVKEKYGRVLVGRFNVNGLSRALTEQATKGIVKIVCHPKTRKILGCHIFCERAGEMIHEAALSIYLNSTVDKLASMIHAFPTFSEAIVSAASNLEIE